MRIAIANDVTVAALVMRRVIESSHEHHVVWIARNGAEAVSFCAKNRPDLLLMDLMMPQMDGIEATRQIMHQSPCAILIVTAAPAENIDLVFRAMGAGALDVAATPMLAGEIANGMALLAKMKMLGKLIGTNSNSAAQADPIVLKPTPLAATSRVATLVVIGASTGGPIALVKVLLEMLPLGANTVVIVQHIDELFADGFAKWLGSQLNTSVKVIEEGSCPMPGQIMLAKTNDHLLLDQNFRFGYSAVPLDYPYRPSINVFFQCVAHHWKSKAIGVLLTGMGRDGAEGLLALRRAGKFTIAQDQASSVVYGMPRAAAELDAADVILPLDAIGAHLRSKTRQRS